MKHIRKEMNVICVVHTGCPNKFGISDVRLSKTIEDYQRLSKTIKDYQRPSKTIEDY